MTTSDTPSPHPSRRLTKSAAVVACVFLLLAVASSPGPGSSLGMPWPLFFCTWGVMSVAALITFLGYLACKQRGERISAFYVICPALLFVALFVFVHRHDIVQAILRLENAN